MSYDELMGMTGWDTAKMFWPLWLLAFGLILGFITAIIRGGK